MCVFFFFSEQHLPLHVLLHSSHFGLPCFFFATISVQVCVSLICMKGGVIGKVVPELDMPVEQKAFTYAEVRAVAAAGYKAADDEVTESTQQAAGDQTTVEILGDANHLSEEQKASLFQLKEPCKYNTMKLKLVNLSFSGASVFFFTPYRVDGTPMPASVMKFDLKECDWGKTGVFLFGLC